jgi:hypothetical protein
MLVVKMPWSLDQPMRVVGRLPVAVVAGDCVHLGRDGEVLLDKRVPCCGFRVVSHEETRSEAVPAPDLECHATDENEHERDHRITPRRRHEHHGYDGDRCRCRQHDEVESAVTHVRVAVVRVDPSSRLSGAHARSLSAGAQGQTPAHVRCFPAILRVERKLLRWRVSI